MKAAPPKILRLVLKRFRSFPAGTVSFGNPTILVGRNGSGKSNLSSAFSFLAEAMGSPLQAVFDRAGGIAAVRNRSSGMSHPPNLGMRVDFTCEQDGSLPGFYAFEVKALPNYGFSVVQEQCAVGEGPNRMWFKRQGREFDTNATGLKPALDPASLGLPVIGGDASFSPVLKLLSGMRVYAIEPGKLRDMQEPDSGVSLKPDGANVTSVLKEIKRQDGRAFERISEMLATIVPNTKRVDVQRHGKHLALEVTQEWGNGKPTRLKFDGFSMSDGTLRAIGLLAAVFQRPHPSVMVIEEPEATIHPGALEAVLELLRYASRDMQLIITTHSPDLLDAEWILADSLRVVEWRAGATRIAPISDANREALQEHLVGAGELMRANALEPTPLFDEQIDRLVLFDSL